MIRKWLVWYVLLTKRLFKRISFWLILLAAPLLVLGMRGISGQEAAVLRMAVYVEPSSDPLGETLAGELQSLNGIIRYERCDSEEELRARVRYGKADGGYIIPADLGEMILAYVEGRDKELPYNRHLIRFVAGEEQSWLKLAREQFFGTLYPYISRALIGSFTIDEAGNDAKASEAVEQELLALYEEMQVEASIFEFSLGDSENIVHLDSVDYLTTPLRGLLSLFVFMGGMAMALYLIRDRGKGLFKQLSLGSRLAIYWLYIFSGTLICGVAAFVGLYISGNFTALWKELLLMLLLVLAVTGFSWILGTVFNRLSVAGSLVPLLILLSAVVCPVFASFHGMKPLKYCLPPYFYLSGLHSARLMGCLVLYVAAVTALGLVCQWIKEYFEWRR